MTVVLGILETQPGGSSNDIVRGNGQVLADDHRADVGERIDLAVPVSGVCSDANVLDIVKAGLRQVDPRTTTRPVVEFDRVSYVHVVIRAGGIRRSQHSIQCGIDRLGEIHFIAFQPAVSRSSVLILIPFIRVGGKGGVAVWAFGVRVPLPGVFVVFDFAGQALIARADGYDHRLGEHRTCKVIRIHVRFVVHESARGASADVEGVSEDFQVDSIRIGGIVIHQVIELDGGVGIDVGPAGSLSAERRNQLIGVGSVLVVGGFDHLDHAYRVTAGPIAHGVIERRGRFSDNGIGVVVRRVAESR